MESTSPIRPIQIALIGDYNREVIAHQAIPLALSMAIKSTGVKVRFEWLPTVACARNPA